MELENAAVDQRLMMRVLLLRDKKSVYGTPTDPALHLAMFRSINPTSNTQDSWNINGDPFQMLQKINTMRYQVLWDKKYSVGPNAVEDGLHNRLLTRKTITLNKKIKIGSEAAEGYQTNANVYLIWYFAYNTGDSVVGLNNIQYKFHIRQFFNQ